METSRVPVQRLGRDGPEIRHADGSIVLRPSRKPHAKAHKRRKTPVSTTAAREGPVQTPHGPRDTVLDMSSVHLGFTKVRVTAPTPGQEPRDALEHRMMFAYSTRTPNEDGLARIDHHRVSLHDIVNATDATTRRMHTAALFDFMIYLYTSPPTGFASMHELLGNHDPLGAFVPGEAAR